MSALVSIVRLPGTRDRGGFDITWIAANGDVCHSVVHDIAELEQWLKDRNDVQ